MENENKKIYNLFSAHKFKTMINIIKTKPTLLNQEINDNKTLIHYATLTNNIKLLKKLIKLEKTQLLYKSTNNQCLPQIALDAGHNNLFFYLIDKYIEESKQDILFGTIKETEKKTITHDVLLKKNFELFTEYYDKYKKYIYWDNIFNGFSYLYVLVNLHYDKLDKIIEMIKNVSTKNLFKYPLDDNSLFYLIYLYHKPEMIYKNDGSNLTKNDSKLITEKQLKEFIKLYPEQLNFSNQVYVTPIYYFGEANNINMLKYCIKLGADVNHISPLGYNNFCHYIMKKSNSDTIEYVLSLDMNFNHIDSNNETPIFNLLRNKENNRIDLISKLLEKTENWDLQNIYGQTILHFISSRSDVEQFYDVIKTRYININVKNKVGTTPLQILEKNFKLLGYDQNKVNDKIDKFKDLIVDNYIKIINESHISVPSEIKKSCRHYKVDDKNKRNTDCWKMAKDNLSKPLYTDIDRLSKNFQDVYIEDHQFAYYNLYNARDADIYYYYYILMSKYTYLGVPNSKTIDNTKINKLSNFDMKSQNDVSNINYLQTLVSNTIKYQSLYPINIYWINTNNYMIPYNYIQAVKKTIEDGKKFIITRINIISNILHANILLIDVFNKRILRFEPQGGINKDDINALDYKLIELFKSDELLKSYKYYKPIDYEPINGLQSLSQETNMLNTRKGDINGFCVAWCLWFVEFYMQNVNNNSLSDNNIKILIPKVIKKIINSGYLISEYIRNYANYIHKKFVSYLTSKTFPYPNVYYDRYTDNELVSLYQHIDNIFNTY